MRRKTPDLHWSIRPPIFSGADYGVVRLSRFSLGKKTIIIEKGRKNYYEKFVKLTWTVFSSNWSSPFRLD